MPELECCQLPGIVHRSLKHEVMVVDEWHDKGPQDLVTVSLCIQNSNNYMQLCSLSMTNASPYHSSPVAIGTTISKALTHTTPFLLSAIFPVQTTLRFIRVGNTSPKCCRMRTFSHSSWLQSGPGWGRQAWRWASLRWFLTVCAKVLWFLQQLVPDHAWGEDVDVLNIQFTGNSSGGHFCS